MDERDVDGRLRRERPAPPPEFRGELQHRLRDSAGSPIAALGRRRRLALAVAAAVAGLALLALAGIGVGGAGPLAP